MARPTKLTRRRINALAEAVAKGHTYKTACALAGVGYSTLRAWLTVETPSGLYLELQEALTRAEIQAEADLVEVWRAAAPTDWRAARDFLARRWPERWGTRPPAEKDEQPTGRVVVYDPEDRECINALVGSKTAEAPNATFLLPRSPRGIYAGAPQSTGMQVWFTKDVIPRE